MTRFDSKNRREKRSYDGRPIPEGMAAAPIWMKREYVNDFDGIRSDCMTTWTFAGIKFLIGYVPVYPDEYEMYKKACYQEINEYLKDRRSGRCITGYRKDGTPRLCSKENRCTNCEHWGEYERQDAAMRRKELSLDNLLFEPSCEDRYFEEHSTEEELLDNLLEHLYSVDSRYPVIIRMLLEHRPKPEVFYAVGIEKSQGYKLISACQKEAAAYLGVGYINKLNR